MAQNDDLFHAVGGGHADPPPLADLVGDMLDEHIRRLGLLGVDDVDVVILLDDAGAARHTVGIEHEDEHTLFEPLIVAQDVHQLLAGGIKALFGELVQLIPRKDDVVAIHQQVFGRDLPLLGVKIRALGLPGRAERSQRVPLDGAIGLFKDLQQLGVLFQRGAVGGHPAGPGSGLFRRAGGLAPAAVHVHVAAHLFPGHHEPGPMGAEDRIRRVVEVVFRLVANGRQHLVGVVAGAVAIQRQTQVPPAPRVAHHIHRVAAHRGGWGCAGQGGRLAIRSRLGRVEAAAHLLDVVHRTAYILGRKFQPEGVPRLQQLRFVDLRGHHQALPHGAVGRLPEVAALGVLEVGAARDEGDLHIGQRGTGQHTKVLFFFEMGQHQTLPVLVQHLFAAVGRKLHPAAAGQRFQLEVDFGIVAERLIVAHALDGLGDRLLI